MAPELKSPSDLKISLFQNKDAWEDWLSNHFDSSSGLWLRISKKQAELPSITYPEALEVALCYGWIDGQKKKYDEISWLQKFTPRGPRSIWSKINRAKALELIERGMMKPAGLAAIERARKNGQWESAYDSFKTTTIPPDLQMALNKSPEAAAFFATLNSQNRYAILFRIQTAKKSETRQKRIEQFIRMLERHEKLYP